VNNQKSLNISTRSFATALAVILALMVAAYLLTLFVPGGSYVRVPDENGNPVIDTEAGFSSVQGGIAIWKWILSPILVLGSTGGGTLIAVIAFLLVIGGVFSGLDRCGLMRYMLDKTAHRFSSVRYRLLAIVTLLFMAMGAMIGSFEECVPLVPIAVALAIHLGWDSLTGMGMSLLAVGCGFASGVCNPFTVGVAQELAGLAMFSGISMRLLSFLLIYTLLLGFLYLHAKRIERPMEERAGEAFCPDARMDRALRYFVAILGAGIALVLCSGFLPLLQDYTMIIVAVTFLIGGPVAISLSGMPKRTLVAVFGRGVVQMLPAVLMILMASSIRYTLEEARVLDTLLHGAIGVSEQLPREVVILFVYLLVLVMNFFIPSGSAKAFMLIPLLVPLVRAAGISSQLCILAFAFGDGFSNVFYPTNPALLISLGLADVSYGKWFRWSGKFQLLNLLLTSGLLLLALAVGY